MPFQCRQTVTGSKVLISTTNKPWLACFFLYPPVDLLCLYRLPNAGISAWWFLCYFGTGWVTFNFIWTQLRSPSWLSCFAFSSFLVITQAFSALTLLVGCQEEHSAYKKWVIWCWCGYLSRTRCKLLAYGPADATATLKPRHLPCLV